MKCVADTSAISWLGRIGRLDLLRQLYEEIYAPRGVIKQLEGHKQTRDFVESSLEEILLDGGAEKRYKKLVRRWNRKLNWSDPVDIEVFILYKFFSDAEEILYANKGAEEIFVSYATIRDIADLYKLAEEKGIFNRQGSLSYLSQLLKEGYRKPYVESLIKSLSI